MTYSTDLKWRAVVLVYFMGMEVNDVSFLIGFINLLKGTSKKSILRWIQQFNRTGSVEISRDHIGITRLRWPLEVYQFVREYLAVY